MVGLEVGQGMIDRDLMLSKLVDIPSTNVATLSFSNWQVSRPRRLC